MLSRQGSPLALLASLVVLSSLALLASADRTLTFINDCPRTIWPAITNYAGSAYTGVRGFELAVGASRSVSVPSTVSTASRRLRSSPLY